jgi:hypothetical protein
MHRVLQTRFGSPGGNCHQAALASLLELKLEDVPDFVNKYPSAWGDHMDIWLRDRGLFWLYFRTEGMGEWLTENVPCIVSVKSLTTPGALHSVIYHRGVVVHDPHPLQAHRWRDVEITGYNAMVAIDAAAVAYYNHPARL